MKNYLFLIPLLFLFSLTACDERPPQQRLVTVPLNNGTPGATQEVLVNDAPQQQAQTGSDPWLWGLGGYLLGNHNSAPSGNTTIIRQHYYDNSSVGSSRSSSPSYSAPSYSAPSYSKSYSAPSYSRPSYSAPSSSYSRPSYSSPSSSYGGRR